MSSDTPEQPLSDDPTPDDPTPDENVSREETPSEETLEPTPSVPSTSAAMGEESGADDEHAEALPELTLGSDGTSPEEREIDPDYVPVTRGKRDKFGVVMGTGRRKTAVARVRITEGTGQLTINGRELKEYFKVERDQKMVLAPLVVTGQKDKVDVWIRVNGGGTTGQTGAIVLGIARAIQFMNPKLHHELSDGGYLTRDDRMVERKKYGYKKARKSFQFSKR